MSEKGLLSKSIANNISEAIIDKLGGTGYAPTEWSKNINLLGIASADIEEALASITEDASSSDKGLLSLSIASDVGAMLNKKYNTSRGFKPSEVSSAVSALTPLPEKTASGAIASFSDGADDVPTKSLVVTIPPTLSGVSSVTETQTGESLANIADVSGSMTNAYFYNIGTDYTLTADVTYKITMVVNSTVTPFAVSVGVGDNAYRYDIYNTGIVNQNGIVSFEFTPTSAHLATWTKLWIRVPRYSAPQEPSTPTTCTFTVANITLYTSATQYTASLGRTIYGGTADIVNGEGQELVKKITVSSFTGTWGAVTNGYAYYISVADTTHSTSVVNPIMMQANQLFTYGSVGRNSAPTWQYGGNDGGTTVHTFILPSEYDTLTKVNNFLASLQTSLEVTLTLATPTDFTFDGKEINTRLGYNAFWSDEGDTEVAYRADLDLYEAPSMLLGANNTETEGNEEQEGNE